MSQWRVIVNSRSKEVILARAKTCAGFFCRMRGLLFTRSLAEGVGIVLHSGRNNRLSAAVHTIGMRYSIAIIWLDQEGIVIDQCCAKPWRIALVPKAPARYVIEAQPGLLDRAAIGDRLTFVEVAA